MHGRGYGQGYALGSLQGQGFWDQFSEDDVEAGDEYEGYADGDGVGVEDGVGDASEPVLELRG